MCINGVIFHLALVHNYVVQQIRYSIAGSKFHSDQYTILREHKEVVCQLVLDLHPLTITQQHRAPEQLWQ